MTISADRVFKEINKLRPLSCALIQYNSCACKKRKLNTERNPRNGCTQRKGQVRTQRKSLSASQGASPWENQPQPHHDLGCPASGAVRKQMSAIQASEDMRFCHGSPSKLIHKHYIEGQTTQCKPARPSSTPWASFRAPEPQPHVGAIPAPSSRAPHPSSEESLLSSQEIVSTQGV